jgi:hypothetical protein
MTTHDDGDRWPFTVEVRIRTAYLRWPENHRTATGYTG